ncbi:membrane protein [Streptococcus pyogenes]|nr:membrane protein [Streptococcus pyogenes]
MTTMQKTISLLSLALLIGLLGTSGKAISVYAQDQHTDNVIAESTISQVSVEASMRGTEPYIDATVITDQPVRQPTQATITLKDASDNTINSWVYTMAAQQRRFTAWFDLTGQKSGDYHVTVTVHT